MASKSTTQIPPRAYRVQVTEVLGTLVWTYKEHSPNFGWLGAPTLSGSIAPDELHTDRAYEVLGYISNEIGATLG